MPTRSFGLNEGHVDFLKSRFLEYTKDHLKNQFEPLDQNAINKLKELPTLFAVEHEDADTRIGEIINIEVRSGKLRIDYKFDEKQSQLTKGALESPELDLNVKECELYRGAHWAIKESNLADFLKKRSKTLEGVFDKIKQDLDALNPEKPDHTKVTVLYACNASGKTRLSKLFYDQYQRASLILQRLY